MTAIAWFVLFSWPLVAIIFYRTQTLPVALIATVLGGYLILPTGIALDVPLLPPLDKTSIVTITAFVLTAIFASKAPSGVEVMPGWLPRSTVGRLLLASFLIGMIGTALTNTDTLVYGYRVLPGISAYDMLSEFIRQSLIFLPVLLARRVLASEEGQKALLASLVVAALIYSLPVLYEVRMSPQLHHSIYGIFPHSFVQHMRGGGFRPLVFLGHGLLVGIFLTCAIIAAAVLWRQSQPPLRTACALAIPWIFAILFLSKNLGAFMIAVAIVPIACLATARTQLLVAACVSMIVTTYPLLRSADLVPVGQVVAMAERINPERAASLGVRLSTEDIMLAKVQERFVFGWGGWGRNRVYTEWGDNFSLTDGAWILYLSSGGWLLYFAIFGAITLPTLLLWLKRREQVDPVCAGLALVLAAKTIDLLPNTGLDALYLLMAGSLLGRLEMQQKETIPQEIADKTEGAPERLSTAYARNFKLGYVRQSSGAKTRNAPSAPPEEHKRRTGDKTYARLKPTSGYRK